MLRNTRRIIVMKKIILLALLCLAMNVAAQNSQTGKIALNATIATDENIGKDAYDLLINKLNQVATQNGCAGNGFDDRFVITAHLQTLEQAMTSTVPAKNTTRISITIYVGDGIDGTLFSSCNTEVKGIGDSSEEAYLSAIRKIKPRDPELIASIEAGKTKIVTYYESVAPSIITSAKAKASGGHLEEAISDLLAIPAACTKYNEAQSLIGKYGQEACDKSNMKIISRARAAWSADPDGNGPEEAARILGAIDCPSNSVLASLKKLTDEISARQQSVADRQFALEKLQAKWEHQETMSRIDAAARVAKAYWNSRPRVVYHYHWW